MSEFKLKAFRYAEVVDAIQVTTQLVKHHVFDDAPLPDGLVITYASTVTEHKRPKSRPKTMGAARRAAVQLDCLLRNKTAEEA